MVRNVRIAGNSLGSRDWTANSTLTTNAWFTGFGAAGKWENIVSCPARLSYDLGVYLANHNSSFKNLQVGLVLDRTLHFSFHSRLEQIRQIPLAALWYSTHSSPGGQLCWHAGQYAWEWAAMHTLHPASDHEASKVLLCPAASRLTYPAFVPGCDFSGEHLSSGKRSLPTSKRIGELRPAISLLNCTTEWQSPFRRPL